MEELVETLRKFFKKEVHLKFLLKLANRELGTFGAFSPMNVDHPRKAGSSTCD